MSVLVALRHHTAYAFDRPVKLGPHVIRLRPSAHGRTPISDYRLTVSPAPDSLHWQEDPPGNQVARCTFQGEIGRLDVTVELVAQLTTVNAFDFLLAPGAEQMPVVYAEEETRALQPYLQTVAATPRLSSFLASLTPAGDGVVPWLVGFNQRLHDAIEYCPRTDPGVFTPEETLEHGVGSCRDTAWLLVQALRCFGLAARFVSGYLIQLDVEVESSYPGAEQVEDDVELHAWAEVYLPGAGWIGLDPTSGLLTAEGHIALAWGREPEAAAPVSGSIGPCTTEMEYDMSVERVDLDHGVGQGALR